jgi:hypothetical protein
MPDASWPREKLEPPACPPPAGFAQGAKNAKFSLADAQIGKRKESISFAEGGTTDT